MPEVGAIGKRRRCRGDWGALRSSAACGTHLRTRGTAGWKPAVPPISPLEAKERGAPAPLVAVTWQLAARRAGSLVVTNIAAQGQSERGAPAPLVAGTW
jgi:hypothetical protein